MSDTSSVAAVTVALRRLIQDGVENVSVTTLPPDQARAAISGRQVNLYLYHTSLSAALRNQDPPGQVKPGERGFPPLPLRLHYLLTAYAGDNEDDQEAHAALGQAMAILHDHPTLTREELALAMPGSDLSAQTERVHVVYQPMDADQAVRIWSAFPESSYRISVAYEVGPVLLSSARPTRTPFPVLRRGEAGRDPEAGTSLLPRVPTITALALKDEATLAVHEILLNRDLVITGRQLAGATGVRLAHPALRNPPVLSPTAARDDAVEFRLSRGATTERDLPAGFYEASVVVPKVVRDPTTGSIVSEEPGRRTNALAFPLAPEITTILPNPAVVLVGGRVRLTVSVRPMIRPGQRVALLLNDLEVPAPPRDPDATDPFRTVVFEFPRPASGRYLARLRVDGVDSPLIDHLTATFAAPEVIIP